MCTPIASKLFYEPYSVRGSFMIKGRNTLVVKIFIISHRMTQFPVCFIRTLDLFFYSNGF